MFWGLPDPDTLVRGMDPDPDPALDLDPVLLSSCKNSKKNLDSYYFVTHFDFLSLTDVVNVASKINKQAGNWSCNYQCCGTGTVGTVTICRVEPEP
jgi:hypothetical protein